MSSIRSQAAYVCRLALDLGPGGWLFVSFMALTVFMLDLAWLHRPQGMLLLPGLLLANLGIFGARKISVWRTLPVSTAAIDRARWWQSIGGPGLLLLATLALPALAMRAWGLASPNWTDIALAFGSQFFCCVLLAGFVIVLPLAGRRWGIRVLLGLVLVLLGLFRLSLPYGQPLSDMRPLSAVLGFMALLGASALYGSAGRWPLPLAGSLLTMRDAAPSGRRPVSTRGSMRGWPVLAQSHAITLGVCWSLIFALPLAARWVLPRMDLRVVGWMAMLTAAQILVGNIAAGMRVLRALPLGADALTLRLTMSLLGVQAISAALFGGSIALTGTPAPPFALLLPTLPLPLLFFALSLRFGPRAAQFTLPLSLFLLVTFEILTDDHLLAMPGAAGLLLAGVALGFLWLRHEIVAGRHAYRAQPLIPSRWRGSS